MTLRVTHCAASMVCALFLLFAPALALADSAEPEAFARVATDSSELRSGPGISFRVIYTAHRGETLALDGRQGNDYWLRVILPDGRIAYLLGDEVEPFAGDPNAPDSPSRPGLFAPPPLEGARGGLAIVGGVLSIPIADGTRKEFGYMEIRPQLVVHKSVTLDGFVGDALTADGSQLLYGGGATIHLAPSWPVCPFFGIGGGGISVFPNSDSFVFKREDFFVGRVNGGALLALRNRILMRLEVSNMTVFDSERVKNAQTYAGGFGVYF